ncbi:hypothetical protein QBZ16_002177 [Prototheca wickerhamii]|uniref:40S ribosomal protein S19 n=1 Tax=Prototheca wickerhamii TaxID=3111 RepID=A0AAD9IP42_PROWI|nr:hypothetical protein QBZ16_002177 [Prototheca wickerhamii]
MAEATEVRRAGPTTVRDVPADEFIKAFAAYLKKTGKITLPEKIDLMKTAPHKELAPYDADWYFTRAAAVARRVYLIQGLGVGHFRRVFGGRSNPKGSVAPEHFAKASGGVIRHTMKQLESLGLLEKVENTKGRRVTREGRRQMDLVARSIQVTPFNFLQE